MTVRIAFFELKEWGLGRGGGEGAQCLGAPPPPALPPPPLPPLPSSSSSLTATFTEVYGLYLSGHLLGYVFGSFFRPDFSVGSRCCSMLDAGSFGPLPQ